MDESDPTSVSRTVVTIWQTFDTATDRSPHDARLRAIGYLTLSFAAQVRAEPPVAGGTWDVLATHHAHTTAEVAQGHDDGAPADTVISAYRQWAVTVTPVGRDGWHGVPTTIVYFLHLTRADQAAPWRVASAST